MTEWVNEKEAQRLMCCGRTMLWMMVRDGRISKRKLGGKNVYSRQELSRYMESLPQVGVVMAGAIGPGTTKVT